MLLSKKSIAIVLLFSSLFTNAQFHKGDKMVGADIASFIFNSGSSEVSFPQTRGYASKSSGYAISIEPAFGWFISDHTVVGGTFILKPTYQKIRYDDRGTVFQEDKNTGFNICIGAFARQYLNTQSTGMLPFIQSGFNTGINSSSSEGFKYYDSTPDYKISSDG